MGTITQRMADTVLHEPATSSLRPCVAGQATGLELRHCRPSAVRPQLAAFLSTVAVLGFALGQSGCTTVSGPSRCPPPQALHLVASAAGTYAIRVVHLTHKYFDTPVGADGRVQFDVPVYVPHRTKYLFGAIKVHSDTPIEQRKIILVMKDGNPVRNLSAADIAKLPADPYGYRVLKLE